MSRTIATLDVLREWPAVGPVLVHADLMRAREFVGSVTSRQAMLQDQVTVLVNACDGRPLWSACFNYDYCRNRKVDLREAKSQVGPLGEYLRGEAGFWRSADPVFSICGNGQPIAPPTDQVVEAFGPQSGLAQLYDRDGTVLFYGATLASATILHFAETRSGGPVYRYDKVFSGEITTTDGTTREIDYVYHVRPMGMSLDYDWQRIESDLMHADLLRRQSVRGEVIVTSCRVQSLVDLWVAKLVEDPLYLLDGPTRSKVEALGLSSGQRLQQRDFEPTT